MSRSKRWKELDPIQRGYIANVMEATFGAEWIKLDSESQAQVGIDCIGLNPTEYKRSIGEGNLASYARTLLAGKDR